MYQCTSYQFPVEGVTSETVHVLSQVKKSENHVMFLLSNEETDRYFTSQRMALTKESASLRLLPLKPRLIEIQKGKSSYGFYLRMEQNTGGKIQVNTQTMTFAVPFLPMRCLQPSFSLACYWPSRRNPQGKQPQPEVQFWPFTFAMLFNVFNTHQALPSQESFSHSYLRPHNQRC